VLTVHGKQVIFNWLATVAARAPQIRARAGDASSEGGPQKSEARP